MKRPVKLYNVLFPIWVLYFFPQVWIITLPGNLLIDCAVLLLTLTALRHAGKKAVLRQLWWKFWLLGFLADFIGAAARAGGVWSDITRAFFTTPFRSLPALLFTLAGVALAGICIYFFDRRAMRGCVLLTNREKGHIALTMAVFTAPWTFLIPLYGW